MTTNLDWRPVTSVCEAAALLAVMRRCTTIAATAAAAVTVDAAAATKSWLRGAISEGCRVCRERAGGP